MLLKPVRINRPDLRGEVNQLVDLICHTQSCREIPVTELVRILGINISENLHQQLDSRGNLTLDEESFGNIGPAITREVKLLGINVELELAENLRGRLTRFPDSFQLAFDPDHSVSMCRSLFRTELRHLDLNTQRIFIDFAGAQDVFIVLE